MLGLFKDKKVKTQVHNKSISKVPINLGNINETTTIITNKTQENLDINQKIQNINNDIDSKFIERKTQEEINNISKPTKEMNEELLNEFKDEKVNEKNIIMIDINQIIKNPHQPRSYFDEDELKNLKESIKENGIIQPLAVRLIDNNIDNNSFNQAKYELIAGERRLRACKMLEFTKVPCFIIECDDKKSSVLALTENIQRNNLSYFEEAKAYLYMLENFNMTQMELSQKFSKSQSAIANKIRLLKFNTSEQNIISENKLTERQCRALLKLEDTSNLKEVIEYINKNNLNTKQTESYIDKVNNPPKKKNRHLIIKDVRCFINTVEKAIDIMNESGVKAKTQKREVDGMMEYVIKIPLHTNSN